ncbi:unnamed protein product [Caenorhabditis brenneri]
MICMEPTAELLDWSESAVWKTLDAVVGVEDEVWKTSIVAAVNSCLTKLAPLVPHNKIIIVAKDILTREQIDEDRVELVLKMLKRMFEENPAEQLKDIVDIIAPSVVKAFHSSSPGVRKNACYCLVSMVKGIGKQNMAPFFVDLPEIKIALIQKYLHK